MSNQGCLATRNIQEKNKYYIWGAGHRGRCILRILGKERVCGFIDSNPKKIGTTVDDVFVTSYEDYKDNYSDITLIYSIQSVKSVVERLESDKIFYFDLADCPPEFSGYGLSRFESYWEDYALDVAEPITLYGSTLFTLELYYKLKEKKQDVRIFLPNDRTGNYNARFKKRFSNIEYCDEPVGMLLFTQGDLYCDSFELNDKVTTTKNVFDWSKVIREYYSKEIADLKGKYKGRCFIIATGPSLRIEDLEILHDNNEFCISMSSIFYCFEETKWRPNVYVNVDHMALDEFEYALEDLESVQYKFVADCSPFYDYSKFSDSWKVIHTVSSETLETMRFSDRCEEVIYNGSTVTYVSIQLAVYMGFEEIYLLGVDFNYDLENPLHFMEGVAGKVDIYQANEFLGNQLEIMQKAYGIANDYAQHRNIKIINVTRGGKLTAFPRQKFEDIINNQNEK